MMADPLLLLDEPGAGVNPTLMDELAEYISRAGPRAGVTILLIEHDMDLVMRLCDPVIVLSEGRPLVEGPFETIAKDPRVLEAYLGGDYTLTLLDVHHVNSGYGEMTILRDISMRVDAGEVVTLIGPNGAGKSTLLKTIFGLLMPTEGRIRFEDTDITGFKPPTLVRRGMSNRATG